MDDTALSGPEATRCKCGKLPYDHYAVWVHLAQSKLVPRYSPANAVGYRYSISGTWLACEDPYKVD